MEEKRGFLDTGTVVAALACIAAIVLLNLLSDGNIVYSIVSIIVLAIGLPLGIAVAKTFQEGVRGELDKYGE